MKEQTYYEEQRYRHEVKIRKLLDELPDFCRYYFIGTKHISSARTRLSYAYDFKLFFFLVISREAKWSGVCRYSNRCFGAVEEY